MAIVIKISFKDDIRRISFEKTPSFQELAEKIYQIYKIQTFKLQYVDEEGDLITIGTDFELSEAVTFAKDSNSHVLKMVITSNEEPNLMASFLGPIESSIPNLVNVISKPIIDMLTQSIQSMSVAGLPNFNAEKKAFDEAESNRKLEEALRSLLNEEEEEQKKKDKAEKQRLIEEEEKERLRQKLAEAERKKLEEEMERKLIQEELERERKRLEEERRKKEQEEKIKLEEQERLKEEQRLAREKFLEDERKKQEEVERKRKEEEERLRKEAEELKRKEAEELKRIQQEELLVKLKLIEEEKRLEEERMKKAQELLELKKAEERRVQEERQRQKLELFQKLEQERLQQEAEKLKQQQEAERLKQMEQEVLRKLEEERLRAQQPIPIHNPGRGLNYSSYFQSKLISQFCGTPNPIVNVPFLVVWTVKNTGEVPWGVGVTLREFHNNSNIKTINFNWNVKALNIGESYDLPVNLSISKAGEYLIQFSLVDASGRKFGDPLEQHVFVSAPPPSVSIPNAYRATIDILHRMGFNDDDLNLSILDNVNGDLNQAIPALLDLTKSR